MASAALQNWTVDRRWRLRRCRDHQDAQETGAAGKWSVVGVEYSAAAAVASAVAAVAAVDQPCLQPAFVAGVAADAWHTSGLPRSVAVADSA